MNSLEARDADQSPAVFTHAVDAALGGAALLRREWLLTNGTGAYSMGTALGCNTRRYHGLFVAATRPPVGRILALNQTVEQLTLRKPDAGGDAAAAAEHAIELSTALFPVEGGLVHAPAGHERLVRFDKGGAARWTYRWGPVTAERTLVLHDRAQAITLNYRVSGLAEEHGAASLSIAPLLTLRDFHGLLHRDDPPSFEMAVEPDGTRLTVERGPAAVTLACAAGRFEAEPDWWFNAVYPCETQRGQDDREDLFTPGRFVVPLVGGAVNEFALTVALGEAAASPVAGGPTPVRVTEAERRLPGDAAQRRALAIAADDFVVRRTIRGETLATIIAGYPWFADWGRDTFIALPGLLLTTGRHDEARDVLKAFAGALRGGLVPNRFDDYDDTVAHYNTVDASLWYVRAGLSYIDATGDRAAWLLQALTDIVDAYAAGTEAEGHDGRPIPIAMDTDGLIAAGDDQSQLTWMDAARDGTVFTPRPGKCVEINALWYHALVGLAELLEKGTAKEAKAAVGYAQRAKQVKRSFVRTFWSDDLGRLIDHVRPAPGSSSADFEAGEADPSLRPNMVFACSLPHSPLPATKRRLVLAAIREHLLTPVGLRTLPPDDPNYHPHYAGPQFDRDKAYHQGTVWPWPLGAYAEGVLRAGKFSKKSKAEAREVLQPLFDRLLDQGLGQLHEIFDAEATPGSDHSAYVVSSTSGRGGHEPRGCPGQAWCIAEVLRILKLVLF